MSNLPAYRRRGKPSPSHTAPCPSAYLVSIFCSYFAFESIFDLLFIEKIGSRLSHRTLIDPFPCEAVRGTRRVSIASSLCFPHQATILPEPPGHAIPQTGSMLVSPPPTGAAAQVF